MYDNQDNSFLHVHVHVEVEHENDDDDTRVVDYDLMKDYEKYTNSLDGEDDDDDADEQEVQQL